MFSCEFCEIFKNTFFDGTPLVAASATNICPLKVNNRNTRKKYEKYLKLTIKTTERRQWWGSLSLLLTFSIFHKFSCCSHCSLWTGKRFLIIVFECPWKSWWFSDCNLFTLIKYLDIRKFEETLLFKLKDITLLGTRYQYEWLSQWKMSKQPAFTCSKLTMETLQQGVKYVQS